MKSIPEIIEEFTPTIDGRPNLSKLAHALGCSRQLLWRWKNAPGKPDRNMMLAWYALGPGYVRRVFAWRILASLGESLPEPASAETPAPVSISVEVTAP